MFVVHATSVETQNGSPFMFSALRTLQGTVIDLHKQGTGEESNGKVAPSV